MTRTVTSNNFNSQDFTLRISNPRAIVLCSLQHALWKLNSSQGLGPCLQIELLKTDRNTNSNNDSSNNTTQNNTTTTTTTAAAAAATTNTNNNNINNSNQLMITNIRLTNGSSIITFYYEYIASAQMSPVLREAILFLVWTTALCCFKSQ